MTWDFSRCSHAPKWQHVVLLVSALSLHCSACAHHSSCDGPRSIANCSSLLGRPFHVITQSPVGVQHVEPRAVTGRCVPGSAQHGASKYLLPGPSQVLLVSFDPRGLAVKPGWLWKNACRSALPVRIEKRGLLSSSHTALKLERASGNTRKPRTDLRGPALEPPLLHGVDGPQIYGRDC